MKHFISLKDYPQKQLQEIVNLALAYKNGKLTDNFSDKILTLIFANPSLRTRLSFESGIKKLGGKVNTLSTQDSWEFEYQDNVVMDQNKQEHIKEAAKVISQYCDIIGLRKNDLMTKDKVSTKNSWADYQSDQAINQLAKYSEKPVINMESNMFHPCQAMADIMTMQESLGSLKGQKFVLSWAPHPKSLPTATPNSQLLAACTFGMNVTLACPPEYELPEQIIKIASKKSDTNGGTFKVSHNQERAFKDANVIVAKSWSSPKFFGDWDAEKRHKKGLPLWTISSEKMQLTNNAYFMHCLPIRRNVVATDAVLDSENSLIIPEAENRMWAQMGIISYLLNQPS